MMKWSDWTLQDIRWVRRGEPAILLVISCLFMPSVLAACKTIEASGLWLRFVLTPSVIFLAGLDYALLYFVVNGSRKFRQQWHLGWKLVTLLNVIETLSWFAFGLLVAPPYLFPFNFSYINHNLIGFEIVLIGCINMLLFSNVVEGIAAVKLSNRPDVQRVLLWKIIITVGTGILVSASILSLTPRLLH